MTHKESKAPLSIRLTEPVVFLRAHPVGYRRHHAVDTPPAMLRGLLSLHLTKPTRVSSIELELEGKSTVHWPEGVGHRRVDIPEEHKFLSTRNVFFSAKSSAISTRSASLGPGIRSSDEDDDSSPSSHHPGSSQSISSLASLSRAARRNSADFFGWQRYHAGSSAATLSPSQPPTPPASPPNTSGSRRLYPEAHASTSQSPYDSRRDSQQQRLRNEENPGQVLEEFRSALRMELGSQISPVPSSSTVHDPANTDASTHSCSFVTSIESVPVSRSASRDVEHREPRSPTPLTHSPIASTSRLQSSASNTMARLHRPRSSQGHEPEHGPRGRHSSRWSLSNMTSVFKDAVHHSSQKTVDRRRDRSPERHSSLNHVDSSVGSEEREGRRREKERQNALGKLTTAAGLEETNSAEGWKEFRKGTYTYPISFAIPANTPPTLHGDYGSVVYRLKAVVHRPGVLTAKIAISTEVVLIECPPDDGSEDTHSIIVEQQWESQLHYLISLNGRSFPIGSQVPFSLTLIPLEKCKLHRLAVFLEEKTEYHANDRNGAHQQALRRFELLSIRHPDKNGSPILPLNPDNAALLAPYIDTSVSSPDEALSSLMGPGPWVLSQELQIPAQCGRIRYTYRHKTAPISVQHFFKVVFRVQRGGDASTNVDPRTGKSRLYDVVVQAPIHILSCHCDPDLIALPRYSLFAGNGDIGKTLLRRCACPGFAPRGGASRGPTPANSRPSTADASIMDADRVNSNNQFARLVSGQESERGEAPPEYSER